MARPVGIILTSVDDASTAKRLAHGLVEAGLAGCVQVSAPGVSVYRWERAIEEAAEHYLSIKTTTDAMPAALSWLEENHPYDTPELVVLEGEAATDYADWLRESCTTSPNNKDD